MLIALKSSPEKKELVEAARKYLQGVKGTLVRQKKEREKALMAQNIQTLNRSNQAQDPPPAKGKHNQQGQAQAPHIHVAPVEVDRKSTRLNSSHWE